MPLTREICSGVNTSITFDNVVIVEVHESENFSTLHCSLKYFVPKGAPWSHLPRRRHGTRPKVAIHLKTNSIVVVYNSMFGGMLYDLGKLSDNSQILWPKKSEDVNKSKSTLNPSITITSDGLVVIVNEYRSNVYYHLGKLGDIITWYVSGIIGEGILPAITCNQHDTIVVTFYSPKSASMFCTTGILNTLARTINWFSPTPIITSGLCTSIVLDTNYVLVCAIQNAGIINANETSNMELLFGVISPNDGTFTSKQTQQLGNGRYPCISLNFDFDFCASFEQQNQILCQFGKLHSNSYTVNWHE